MFRPELVPIESPFGSFFGCLGFRVELRPVKARTIRFYRYIKRSKRKHSKKTT